MDLRDIKDRVDYNPETGIFRWKNNYGSRAKGGSIAGHQRPDGYRVIIINKKQYMAHRLAFLLMTGKMPMNHVDHINGCTSDNRWCNLRDVSRVDNLRNQKIPKSNSSGVVGVYWHKASKKWDAQIKVNYRTIHLGMFDKVEDAITARKEANKRYGFHEIDQRYKIKAR